MATAREFYLTVRLSMRVLIFGATGNLGHQVMQVFQNHGHEAHPATREGIDTTDLGPFVTYLQGLKPDVIINAAAYNNVDGCEQPENKVIMETLNVVLPGVLAKAALGMNARFVHFSTDYVFSGEEKTMYEEMDETRPISAYGRSKREGELAVASQNGQWYVCRLSKIFGPSGSSPYSKSSFLATMIRLAKEKSEINVVDDEIGTPTYTKDIAEATLRMIEDQATPGYYHLVNEGAGVTWYAFAKEFFSILGTAVTLRPVGTEAYPTLAKRPKHVVMRNTKLPKLRSRREALVAFFDDYPELR